MEAAGGDPEATAAGAGVLPGVAQGPQARAPAAEGVGAARVLKVAGLQVPLQDAVPGSGRPLPRQLVAQLGEIAGPVGHVHGVERGDHAGVCQKVPDGRPPFLVIDALQPAVDAQDAPHVAHVAVRVPAAHVADAQGLPKVSLPVEHGEDHHPGVGDDVAVPRVFVVAEVFLHKPVAVPPVLGVGLVEVPHRPDYPGVLAVSRNVCQGLFQHRGQVRLHKGQADAAGHIDPPVHPVAVVGDAGGLLRQRRRQGRVARGHIAPGVNEDLPADLLRHRRAVLGDAAASGGGNPRLEI